MVHTLQQIHPSRSRRGCQGSGDRPAPASASTTPARPRHPCQLVPQQWHIHLVEGKYCEDTRPYNQLHASTQQHRDLCRHLQRAAAKVTLHNILLGVGGVIYITPLGTFQSAWP